MEHDLFSGEAVALTYSEGGKARPDDVAVALNDDAEIDEILM